MLSQSDRTFLLKTARLAIAERLQIPLGELPVPGQTPPATMEKMGAFVTLHARSDLRGCIGYTCADRPLVQVVRRSAQAAAFGDDRFTPVRRSELADLQIEISVLTVPIRADDPSEVEVGRHGIIISQGPYRGLLLPQVATEHHWDRDAFLANGCVKAGLPRNAYTTGALIEVFEAEVFGEESARAG
ncbi:MAG: AmmeMemoRadiSam system protein A [Acidobacteria bacterium]|nr:AmmeMemoRadiSam system protein A [Acidobacteriota bacterium]